MTERMNADQLKAAVKQPKFRGKSNGRYGGKRHVPGEMNKTEQRYAELLEQRRIAGEVVAWSFESITFKLAKDCRYTPDFFIELANGEIECVDTKGTGPVDPVSKVKARTAAEKFYQFRFVMEQQQTKKDGGGWKRTEY